MSPHLPITPDEIAEEAIAAADAGASILHLHVRDPETGEPITNLDLFREVFERVDKACDAIIQPTTGAENAHHGADQRRPRIHTGDGLL